VSGSDPELIVEHHDAVTVLRLNRPEASNALSPSLVHAIGTGLIAAESDGTTRAVVLTGSGERAFCGGMDLRSFAQGERMPGDEAARAFLRLLAGEVAVPVVGAANATAVAGGFELLLACDLVVAADSARFGLPEVRRGLIPAGGGTMLGARIPLALAMELVLTGDLIDAARAQAMGLVNVVVPAEAVLDTALALAGRIAANGPLAVRAARELVRLGAVDVAAARARLEYWRPVVFGSEDAAEGARAFVEKRAPRWQDR